MTNDVNSHHWHGSESRRDASSAAGGPDWVQRTMLPPEHLQIDVRVLWNGRDDVVRYQIEVQDPSTKELLAMRSRPFHDGLTVEEGLSAAVAWTQEALGALNTPF